MKLLTSLILCFTLLYTLILSVSAHNVSCPGGNGIPLSGSGGGLCLCDSGYTSSDGQGYCYDGEVCSQCVATACDVKVQSNSCQPNVTIA
jgi:hypothetical protein